MENNSCIRQQADIKQINRCKDTVLELNESFDYLANGLSLVGNNVRLKILAFGLFILEFVCRKMQSWKKVRLVFQIVAHFIQSIKKAQVIYSGFLCNFR